MTNLPNPLRATLCLAAALLTAAEAPGQVAFHIPTSSVVEGTQPVGAPSPWTYLDVTVQRTDGGVGPLDIAVQGDRRAGYTYLMSPSQLVWSDGDTSSRTVTLEILADGYLEGDQLITLELRPTQTPRSTPPIDTGSVTVIDDDSEIRIDGVAAQQESGGSVVLTLRRIGPPIGDVSVAYLTHGYAQYYTDGSRWGHESTPGVDFPQATGTLSWSDGDSTPQTLEVFWFDDCDAESGDDGDFEWLFVTLTPTGFVYPPVEAGDLEGPHEMRPIKLLDDDHSPRQLSFLSPTARGSETGDITVPVSRSGLGVGPASATITALAVSATPGEDFDLASATLHWADGETGTKAVVVQPVQDGLFEGTEVFELELSQIQGTCLTPGTTRTRVTLFDSDGPPTLSFTQTLLEVEEREGQVDFEVSRTGTLTGAANVKVRAVSASARAGSDFDFPEATLSWAADEGGVQRGTVALVVDDTPEDTETFHLELFDPSPDTAVLPPDLATATVAILESSSQPEVRFSESVYTAEEARGTVELVLELTRPVDRAVTASVQLAPGGRARPNVDLVEETWKATWEPLETGSRSISVALIDDGEAETAEAATFRITSVLGSNPGALDRAKLWILDDDFEQSGERIALASAGTAPRLAATGRGTVTVFSADDGDGSGVFARLDARDSGQLTLRVPESAQADQRGADVAAFGNQFVAAWIRDDGSSSIVRARRFQPDGQPLGPSFDVSTAATVVSHVRVGVDGRGDAFFSWLADGTAYGRRFSAAGVPLEGAATLSQESAEALDCAVSVFGDRFCALGLPPGLASEVGTVQASDEPNVQYLLDVFDAQTGSLIEGPRGVVEGARSPRVAALSGAFALGSVDTEGTSPQLLLFDGLGRPRGSAVRLGEPAPGAQPPSFARGRGRELAVLFRDLVAGTVRGRFYSSDGRPLSSELVLAGPDSVGVPAAAAALLAETDLLRITYERRDPAGNSLGLFVNETLAMVSEGACSVSEGDLCLGEERFRVRVAFRSGATTTEAPSTPLTTDTAYSWFFDQDNVEVVYKLLDGCAINGHYWLFAAGLTDVAVELSVEDTLTGKSSIHWSRFGTPFQPLQNTRAIPCHGSPSLEPPAALR